MEGSNLEFEIEVQERTDSEQKEIPLPLNYLHFGQLDQEDVRVYIRQNVYKELEGFAASDVTTELGSFLIGDFCENLGKTYVIISDWIEARYTDASASTLTFTHETWDYVYKEKDSKYPDKKIIGWQ
ncbi:MAG: hypothetical protein IKU18_00945, partial [Bacteroidales bacterium]|nr:hypothetical protein [Bacteroidales bacterium]